MTKLFRVIPKRVKCSNGIGVTPEMVVVDGLLNQLNSL